MMNSEERRDVAQRMLQLHREIAEEIEKPQVDPGRLMRLTAAGVNQCMMALAIGLTDGDLPDPDEVKS